MAELAFHHRSQNRAPRDETPRVRWLYAIIAGVVAGIAYLVMQSVLGSIIDGDGIWEPFNRIAAMALGPSVLEDADAFNLRVVTTALSIHLGLAALYGLVVSCLIVEFTRDNALMLGAIAGLLIYLVNFYGFAGLFPWMAETRGAITIFSHVVFGGLLTCCYWALYADRHEARLSAG